MTTHARPRRLGRLVLAALAALVATLSLSAAAEAQSASLVQIKPIGTDPDGTNAIGLRADLGAVLQVDDDRNFRQHWERRTVAKKTYVFESRLFSQNGCLKVRDNTSPSSYGKVTLGSCSSPRARWRRKSFDGPGDLLVNVGTGHAMLTPFCFAQPCDERVGVAPSKSIEALDFLLAWGFDFL